LPTSLVGVIIFVTLLTPGFVYVLRSERRAPERQLSAFRETIILGFVSFAADIAALAIFTPIRILAPGSTPDIGALIRDPSIYFPRHYALVALWGLGLLILACLLAYVCASPAVLEWLRRFPALGKAVPERPYLPYVSGWDRLLARRPGTGVYVECLLEDGSYVAGWIYTYSRLASETGDRELTLKGPLRYRPPRKAEAQELPGVGAVSISSRRLTALFVSYVTETRQASDS
jgi:hypothetical protein